MSTHFGQRMGIQHNPASVATTKAALSYSTTQTNPTVERGIPHKKTKVKKLPKEKVEDKASQTDPKDK